jgi:hypothetical protein
MDRSPRTLEVATELSDVLHEFRSRGGADEECELNLDRLQDVEAAVGVEFQDDILALVAVRSSYLREKLGVDLARVVAHTGELRERGQRGDVVGIGRIDDTTFLCVEKREQSSASTELFLLDCRGGSRVGVALLAWLSSHVEELPSAGSSPAKDVARLVRPEAESTAAGVRVHHKIFGNGRALSERGTGDTRKVTVDFPGKGLKLLQGRFLEYLDD